MNKPTRLRLLLVPLVVLLATVSTSAATASPPTPANGTVVNTSATFNSVRAADGNLIIDLNATAAYTEMLPTRTSAGKRQNLLVPPPRGAMKWPSHVARA